MGLIVNIYRDEYDSHFNAFVGKSGVTVVNIPGPFEPTVERPAALLTTNALGSPIIVPAYVDSQGTYRELKREGVIGPMMGGTYAATSDSRFSEATKQYGAVAIHDRFESPATYAALSD